MQTIFVNDRYRDARTLLQALMGRGGKDPEAEMEAAGEEDA